MTFGANSLNCAVSYTFPCFHHHFCSLRASLGGFWCQNGHAVGCIVWRKYYVYQYLLVATTFIQNRLRTRSQLPKREPMALPSCPLRPPDVHFAARKGVKKCILKVFLQLKLPTCAPRDQKDRFWKKKHPPGGPRVTFGPNYSTLCPPSGHPK